ncbi:hypothetical protein TNCV_4380241 [Trichonephila clavipes]|nr:hypothetical protein TNCV_4380241 [Trichonephila clavipes]
MYNSKYDSSSEINPDLEEEDNVENKCFTCRWEHLGRMVLKGDNWYTSYPLSDEFSGGKTIVGTKHPYDHQLTKIVAKIDAKLTAPTPYQVSIESPLYRKGWRRVLQPLRSWMLSDHDHKLVASIVDL